MGTNTRDTNFGISTLGTASDLGDLIDGTDSIHTGILKALNQQTAGSFVAHGLNVTQNGSTFAVSSGGWFDKGEYKTGTPTAVNDNLNSSGAKDHYAFLVIPKDSSALALRVHASAGSTSVKVASLTAGDIPVCLIKVAAGSSAGARAIQFYGIKKLDSEFTAVNNETKTLRITKAGKVLVGSSTGEISFPDPSSSNVNLITSGDTGTVTNAMLAGSIANDKLAGSIANAKLANSAITIDGTSVSLGGSIATTNTQLSTEQVQDIVGAMFTGNTETNITATYEDGDGTIDLVSTDTNTQLTLLDEDNMSSNSATAAASQQSIKAYVDGQVTGLVDSAPGALDTLNELAAALGDDASFSTTMTTALGNRLRIDVANQSLTATQKTNALTNLGVTATVAELNYIDGVTSAIQTQMDAKLATTAAASTYAPIADPTFTGEIGIGSVNVSETELGILEGATLSTTELNVLDGGLSASDIPSLPTSKITSGTFADSFIASASTWNAKQDALTFATGLLNSSGTVSLNFNALTDLGSGGHASNDFIPVYDADATAYKKVNYKNILTKITADELISSGSGTGTVFTTLPASGATVGGTLGSGGNILLEDGSTKLTDATALNANTTKSDVGLGNVDNLSASDIRAGTTAANVGLGNVTNESKATMFASPTFTGTIAIPNISNLETAVAANTAKTGITSTQASNIIANNAKVSFPGLGTTSTTALAGNTAIPVDLTTDGAGTVHANNYTNTVPNATNVVSSLVAASSISNSDKGSIRSNIGAGTSSFDGAYSSLSSIPSTFAPVVGTGAGDALAGNTTVTNWSGASSGLTASTGRTSLGATTLGSNLFTATNPDAITFLRINANNTISALNASDFRTAIGAGSSTDNNDYLDGITKDGNDTLTFSVGSQSDVTFDFGALGFVDTVSTSLIDDNAVTFAKMQDIGASGTNTLIVGRTANNAGAASAISAPMISVITAADAAAVRSVIGAGTSSLALGTSSTTALAGNTSLFSGDYDDLSNKPTLLALGTSSSTALAGDTTTISSAQSTKLGHISVTQAVDLDTMESNIATNNSKVTFPGLGTSSSTALAGNTAVDNVSKTNLSTVLGSYTGDDTLNIGDAGNDTTINIKGNLNVLGTTTTLNKTEIDVQDAFVFGYDNDSSGHTTTLRITDPSANRTVTIPDASFTIPTQDTTPNATNVTSSLVAASSISGSDKTSILSNIGAQAAGSYLTSVGTSNIADDAVTYAKLQDTTTNNRLLGAVTAGTIGEVQVTTEMIADSAIEDDKLDNGAVITAKISDDAVTYAKMQNMTTGRILGRATANTGIIEELTKSQVTSFLQFTDVGAGLTQLTNPSAVTFIKINADNTLTARSAADFRSDIGAGTSSVAVGTGSGDALAGNTTTITTAQANAITANTAKTGITSTQASNITTNNSKVSFTESALKTTLAAFDSGDTVYIGDGDNDTPVTVRGTLDVLGDVTFGGSATNLEVNDNLFLIGKKDANENLTGGGSLSSHYGIEVEAGKTGSSHNTHKSLRYNTSSGRWEFTNDGSNFFNLPVSTEYGTGLSGTVDVVSSGNVPTANDIARFTDADTLEGLTYAQLRTALNVADGANANVSGDSGNAAIYDNSGTPAFKSGITKAEVLSLLNVTDGATANTGTVTELTVGVGLDITNGTTTPDITLDLKEIGGATFTTADSLVGFVAGGGTGNQSKASDTIGDILSLIEIVDDTSPQLGGNLDTNDHNIIIDTSHGILDENSNEQMIFTTTSNATNYINITNNSTGNAPILAAVGSDDNVTLNIRPKGSGYVNFAAGDIQIGSTALSATAAELNVLNAVNAERFIGRLGGSGAGSAEEITVAQALSLLGVSSGAEPNVQVNWNETSSSSDAFILNKPTLLAVGTGSGDALAGNTTVNDVSVANLKTALGSGFAGNAVTIGDSDDVVTIGNDLTVTGDLIVSGDTVTVNTATLSVEDPLVYLANGQTGTPSVDIGLIGERGSSTNVGIIWDESADTWAAINTADTGTTAGNVTIASYANMKASTFTGALTGDVTGDVTGNADTATKIASITNSNIVQLDASQTLTNKTIAVSQITELSNLTAAEGEQLENIGTTTISAAQWGYLGAATGAITNTDTTYSAGTNISLSGTTFNVDDAFLINSGNDSTTGTITAGGFTTAGSITLGGHAVNDIDVAGEFEDSDNHLMTSAAINDKYSVIAGSTSLTTLGTIGTGTWQGTAIAQAYIADQAINEAKLQVSNAPTNGYVLTAQSGNTGGLTWAAASSGGASAIGGLDDVMMDATNFADGLLIQPDSDGSAPSTGTLSSASNNIGIGRDVFNSLTSGSENYVIGSLAGYAITSGSKNVLMGKQAGEDITTDTGNTILGYRAGQNITSDYNVAMGYNALQGNASTALTGDYNVAIGYQTLQSVEALSIGSIAIGRDALKDVTTSDYNIAIGYEAGKSVTTGPYNVAIGYRALDALTTNGYNVAVGMAALGQCTSGNNVAVGADAGRALTSGIQNVFVGYATGYYATSSGNTLVGYGAGDNVTTGGNNTLIGRTAGGAINTGTDNIMIGLNAGDNITSGDNNVIIGAIDADSATADDQLIIASGDGGLSWIKGDSNGNVSLNQLADVVTASGSSTVLTQAQSGSYVYWTAGTLALPTDAAVGTQFTIFNNTGSSATVTIGDGADGIVTNWASNAAVADNDATAYVCVAVSGGASSWVQVGA